MIFLKRHLRLRFIGVLVLLAWTYAGHGQGPEKQLLDRAIPCVETRPTDIRNLLSDVAYSSGTPIGLELAQAGKTTTEITLGVQKRTVRDVLNAIIEQNSSYEWKVADGVLNIFPKVYRDDVLETLLNIRVKKFEITAGTSSQRVRDALTNLPEVKTELEKASLRALNGAWTNADVRELSPGFTFSIANATVREILNQIVKTSDGKFWIVNRYGDKNQFLIVNFH